MNIVIDVSHLYLSKGGIYCYLRNLIPGLENEIRGTELTLRYLNLHFRRSQRNVDDLLETEKCISLRLPVRLVNHSWIHFRFPDLSWFYPNTEIFHGTHFSLPHISKAKTVLTVHDITYLKHPEYYKTVDSKLNDYGYKKLLATNVQRADKIISISEFTKKDLVDHLNVPASKIDVVYHGIAKPNKLSPESLKNELNAYALDVGGYIYFPAGSFDVRKNIESAVDAYLETVAGNGVKLVISGVGVPADTLSKKAIDDIKYVEWNSEQTRDALYQGALYVIYPSLYEGFGIPIIEAMANGKAVLTSNTSSMREIAGNYAHLIDPHNSDDLCRGLLELFKNTSYRTELEQKGFTRANDFTIEKMAKKHIEVYKELYNPG